MLDPFHVQNLRRALSAEEREAEKHKMRLRATFASLSASFGIWEKVGPRRLTNGNYRPGIR